MIDEDVLKEALSQAVSEYNRSYVKSPWLQERYLPEETCRDISVGLERLSRKTAWVSVWNDGNHSTIVWKIDPGVIDWCR